MCVCVLGCAAGIDAHAKDRDAVEQADEADEARGVGWRRMALSAFRGWVRIVRGGARSRASQLIRGVGPAAELRRKRWPDERCELFLGSL